MDDNLQKVFSVLISILIFFILPLYITFEKLDDISYSLALKITSNFVDNVTAKGYLSEEMYNDFITRLSVTGNVYEVKMEHVSKKYTPVYYLYNRNENSDNGKVKLKKDYSEYINWLNNNPVSNNAKLSYSTSEVKYSEKQILNVIKNKDNIKPFSEMSISDYVNINLEDIPVIPYMYANYNVSKDDSGFIRAQINNENKIYTMNKGDEFNVRIRNENVTIATILFNAFTLGVGGVENNTRVYINYGGTIQEEEYRNLYRYID